MPFSAPREGIPLGVDASDGTTVILRSLDDEAQSLHLTPGCDNLTGVGSPDEPGYVFALGGRGR